MHFDVYYSECNKTNMYDLGVQNIFHVKHGFNCLKVFRIAFMQFFLHLKCSYELICIDFLTQALIYFKFHTLLLMLESILQPMGGK